MPITSQRPEYVDNLSEWVKAVDLSHSEKRVHDKTTTYLPRLIAEEDDVNDLYYAGYLSRAVLSMFLKKVVKTYVGMATRKPVSVAEDEHVVDFLENVTGTGKSMNAYVSEALDRYFTTGRCGTLVDLPLGTTNSDPMFLLYNEVDIPYWSEEVVDGKKVLTQVILTERVLKDSGDKFETEMVVQYRVLELVDGVYQVEVYDDKLLQVGETIAPLMNNKALDYIPFMIHGGVDVTPSFLTEIVNLQLHHYKVSASLGHGLHWCGLPTPYDTGGEDVKKTIGPMGWLTFPQDTTVGFLEFEGKGLSELSGRLQVFEDTMSQFAVSMVNSKGDKTATQSNIDDSNQTASLAGEVMSFASEMTVILNWACAWMGKECGEVKLNTDFVSKRLSPEEVNVLMTARLNGSMSEEMFFWNMKQGEMYEQGREFEEERAAVDESIPASMTGEE